MKPEKKWHNSKQDMKRFCKRNCCPCVITHLLRITKVNMQEACEGGVWHKQQSFVSSCASIPFALTLPGTTTPLASCSTWH